MDEIFLLVLLGLSSGGAYAVGTRRLGLPPASLRAASARMFETVGIALIFGVANMTIAVVVILTTRAATGRFLPLYMANDITLWVLSGLQGLIFQWWTASGSRLGRT
jgi:hypothetical protein